jgi:ferredoxin--NADP+ reductase
MSEQPIKSAVAEDSVAADPFNATLLKRIDLNEELAVFKIKPDCGEVAQFSPGQYTTLGLPADEDPNDAEAAVKRARRGPKLIRRAYSIASSPKQRDHMDFYIVRVEEGKLTPKLWQLKAGDRIFMDGKCKGNFTMDDVPPGKDLVMVGTGTGMAPFMSMLRTYRGTGRWRKFVVLDGCRYIRDLGYRSDMEKIAAEDPTVIYIPTVTREPADAPWTGHRGRVNVILEPENYLKLVGTPLTPEQCHVFLCGNPQMIDQGEETLQKRGFVVKNREHPDGNIHFERYW